MLLEQALWLEDKSKRKIINDADKVRCAEMPDTTGFIDVTERIAHILPT